MNFDDIAGELVEFETLEKKKVNRLIREAMQDICQHTWIWTDMITFLTAAGTRDYTLTPSVTESKIIGIPEDGMQIATVYTPQPEASDSTDAGTLTPATSYSYRVTAYADTYGQTLPCAVISHTCPATGAIDLEWDPISGADGYYIYGNNGAGTTYTYMASTTSTTYTDDGTDTPDGVTEPPTESNLMNEIQPYANILMRGNSSTWRQVESDWISGLIFDGINSVRTNRVPETSGIGFQVTVALSPTESYDDDIPSIFERHVETILKYVRARVFLFSNPSKDAPWLNYSLGKKEMLEYRADRNRIKARKMTGNAPLSVQMRRFV